jgi:hypothetical protein
LENVFSLGNHEVQQSPEGGFTLGDFLGGGGDSFLAHAFEHRLEIRGECLVIALERAHEKTPPLNICAKLEKPEGSVSQLIELL